jgi:hypothetical protein
MIRRIKMISIERRDFIAIVLLTVVPVLPLILMVVPLKMILSRLLRPIA